LWGSARSYDFVEDRTHDGRKYRMLNVLDEFSHECLAIRVARELKAMPRGECGHETPLVLVACIRLRRAA
jgi:hypothetical protein